MSSKRPAGYSPDTRPAKRPMTSSPEEGELDDVTPPRPSLSSYAPSSPRPSVSSKPGGKVPFPFKKKPTLPDSLPERPPPPLAYSRPDEDVRHRDDDARRNGHSRQPRARPGDHWAPAYGDSRGPPPRPQWEQPPARYDDDRSYRTRVEPDHWEPREHASQGLVSPRPSRRSRSPSSPRSRSPFSPESTGKEKHRLPRPTLVEADRRYGDDSRRSWDRSRERHPDYRKERSPAWGDSYRPNDDAYYSSRVDRDDRYRSRHADDDDRKYSHSRSHDRLPPRPSDNYHPLSPRTPLRPLSPPRSPRALSPRYDEPRVPIDDDKSDALPLQHNAVKISLPKKPPTPRTSPSAFLLNGRDARKALPEELQPQPNGEPSVPKAPAPIARPRRKPVHRSREEEKAAYGRIFEGCGLQGDYDVLMKLGEGTFGEVHKAVHRMKGHQVALKRILMHNEKEGMPITALREIKILKALRHANIVDILDMFVVRSRGSEAPLSVYMVFPYMDHDLAGLLENERVKLSPSQIKLYMKQLLEGTEYMHRNRILHRDMKAANLLISNSGSLKIADFGLARAFDPNLVRDMANIPPEKQRKYTNCVVTRWYRPPELLLGARQYGGEVDIWGIGCVLGEMFWRKPILPGSSDLDQLDKIWQLCGTPTSYSWPDHDSLPGCEGVKRFNMYPRRVKTMFESIGPETVDLLDKLLTCNPRERLTASQALDHDYFWTDPLPADPKTLPTYEASHEFDKRGRRQPPIGPPVHPPVEAQRPPAAPTRPPLHYSGRPPPPRESFRNGPAPHAPLHVPAHHHTPASRPPPPMRYAAAPVSVSSAPVILPPVVYRPGERPSLLAQPPPNMEYPSLNRPAHLPPRPQDPLGGARGTREPREGRADAAASELNYG